MIIFSQFDGVILAARTTAVSNKAQFIAECNKECAGIVQKNALKNTFLMAICT